MIRKFTLACLSLLCGVIILDGVYNTAHTNQTGAPAGNTGSAVDGGNSCAQSACHAGTPVVDNAFVTISGSGSEYVPNQTHTITVTAMETGVTKFGFQSTVLTLAGAQAGTLVATNSTETQLVGAGKYITHKLGGTSTGTTGTKVWTYDWTAPASGAGTLILSTAANGTNADGTKLGDKIKLSTVVLTEGVDAVEELSSGVEIALKLFPVPVFDNLHMTFDLKEGGNVAVELFDLTGKMVRTLNEGSVGAGPQSLTFANLASNVSKGMYFVKFNVADNAYLQKILVR